MIAQEHFHIGHGHDLPQNPDTPGMPVDHISQHIKCILRPQPDLLHNRPEPAFMAVNIGKHINHRKTPFFNSAALIINRNVLPVNLPVSSQKNFKKPKKRGSIINVGVRLNEPDPKVIIK